MEKTRDSLKHIPNTESCRYAALGSVHDPTFEDDAGTEILGVNDMSPGFVDDGRTEES